MISGDGRRLGPVRRHHQRPPSPPSRRRCPHEPVLALDEITAGDQAIFARRAAFDAVGEVAEQPLMEDLEISRRLKRLSPPLCLTSRVVTSGRRWERHSVRRTIFLMWRLRMAYWRAVPPETLERRYGAGDSA